MGIKRQSSVVMICYLYVFQDRNHASKLKNRKRFSLLVDSTQLYFHIPEMMISAARYGNCSSAEGRKNNERESSVQRQNIEKREGICLFTYSYILYHLPVNQTH